MCPFMHVCGLCMYTVVTQKSGVDSSISYTVFMCRVICLQLRHKNEHQRLYPIQTWKWIYVWIHIHTQIILIESESSSPAPTTSCVQHTESLHAKQTAGGLPDTRTSSVVEDKSKLRHDNDNDVAGDGVAPESQQQAPDTQNRQISDTMITGHGHHLGKKSTEYSGRENRDDLPGVQTTGYPGGPDCDEIVLEQTSRWRACERRVQTLETKFQQVCVPRVSERERGGGG